VSAIDASELSGALPLADAKAAQRAVTRARKRGVLGGNHIFWMFSLTRPNEAFWSYWVANFLLGTTPPPNDLLFWANENTNIPAALLRDLLDVYVHNKAIRPGAMTVLGQKIDLSKVRIDLYTLAAERDHLIPWQGGYRSLKHFPGHRTFVLHSKGHIMALIDPPPGTGSTYCVRDGGLDLSAQEWRAGAQRVTGSWWPHWASWLAQRSGARVAAPAEAGSLRYPALGDAPGNYVRFSAKRAE
jgi:poly(3-hydroxyalkanoate) synthetase